MSAHVHVAARPLQIDTLFPIAQEVCEACKGGSLIVREPGGVYYTQQDCSNIARHLSSQVCIQLLMAVAWLSSYRKVPFSLSRCFSDRTQVPTLQQ